MKEEGRWKAFGEGDATWWTDKEAKSWLGVMRCVWCLMCPLPDRIGAEACDWLSTVAVFNMACRKRVRVIITAIYGFDRDTLKLNTSGAVTVAHVFLQ